jgi:hypothetical protein
VKRIADCVNTLQISGERVDREYLDMAPGVLRALAAERNALKAEVEQLHMALKEAEYEMASGCDATAYRVIRAALHENTDD